MQFTGCDIYLYLYKLIRININFCVLFVNFDNANALIPQKMGPAVVAIVADVVSLVRLLRQPICALDVLNSFALSKLSVFISNMVCMGS